MINFFPNAGAGTKITAKFKSKVFSFGDVLVDRNKLTLYQISEPLQSTSSATPADPAPFGTDINGVPLHDPIPDTEVDPSTGQVVSVPATGPSALLDAWTVTKPEVDDAVVAQLSGPDGVKAGQNIAYKVSVRNDSDFALSGTQVRFRLPHDLTFAGTPSDVVTVQGDEIVFTLGHLAVGAQQTVEIQTLVRSDVGHQSDDRHHEVIRAHARVYSSTALPVETNEVFTELR
jgi:uncharacterized repeat protein (TIGR01451 family)